MTMHRGTIESALRARIDSGGKALVPYITGGFDGYLDAIRAAAHEGADAIEVGIPFSDPVMDGPVIQEANEIVLAQGVTPQSILDELRGLDVGIPLAAMTYYNIAYRFGLERFANSLTMAGVAGAILPDLPLSELGPWANAADADGVETVLLVAPTTPDPRLQEICDRSRGFVYAVGLLGVTGVRSELADSATVIARRCKDVTEKPVLVGVGVSTPDQAAEVSEVADGCVVGSAIVRRLLEGEGPEGVGSLVAEIRAALDG
ncbi:MAG: tryptophan synthase subunit alpha [Acidimicrobiales bacterium]